MIFTKNIEEYNRNKQQKILTVFGDMVGDMLSKKELSIRGRKAKTSLIFLHILNLLYLKMLDLNYAYCFIMKISNK